MPFTDIAPHIALFCENVYRSKEVKDNDRTLVGKMLQPFRLEPLKRAVTYQNNIFGSYANAFRAFRDGKNNETILWCEHISSSANFSEMKSDFRLAVYLLSIVSRKEALAEVEKSSLGTLPYGGASNLSINDLASMVQIGVYYNALRKEIINAKPWINSPEIRQFLESAEYSAKSTERRWATSALALRKRIMEDRGSTPNREPLGNLILYFAPPIVLYKILWIPGAIIGASVLPATMPLTAIWLAIEKAVYGAKNLNLEKQKKAAEQISSEWIECWDKYDGNLERPVRYNETINSAPSTSASTSSPLYFGNRRGVSPEDVVRENYRAQEEPPPPYTQQDENQRIRFQRRNSFPY
jgi:hypothetical protein